MHALTDRNCRPLAFLLTGGNVADCTAADDLLDHMPETSILHGDKGYDTNAMRRKVEDLGVAPNIPPNSNRIWKNCFSPVLYRNRNAIERMFGRIKDFRRIATRYDTLARNFLSAIYLVATGRGREAGLPAPPAQIPACAANAPGSSLGFWRRSGDRVEDVISGLAERNDRRDG